MKIKGKTIEKMRKNKRNEETSSGPGRKNRKNRGNVILRGGEEKKERRKLHLESGRKRILGREETPSQEGETK